MSSGSGARRERNPASKPVAVYSDCDAGGELLYQVVRNEPALFAADGQGSYAKKDFSQRRPDGQGKWIYNLDGLQRVLYRFPALIVAIREGETIYVPEGEKDADALCALGLVATCNAGGAGKWGEGYSEALRGADVVILPDNDRRRREHRRRTAPCWRQTRRRWRRRRPASRSLFRCVWWRMM